MNHVGGIYNCRYHFFWIEVMKVLEVDIDTSLDSRLLERDKVKLRKIISEHDHVHMARIKDKEHPEIRTELEKRFKNIGNNM